VKSERIASLDLLRGLAALAVAIPHFLVFKTIGGDLAESESVIAVEIFFVLSGYVLGPQILNCLNGSRFRNLRIFLVRRWMRTIPPYLVALFLVSALYGQLYTEKFFAYAFYVQNLVALGTNDYYPVAWSLSVEEWFYLVFPSILLGVTCLVTARKRPNDLAMLVAILFIAAVSIVRLTHGYSEHWGEQVRRVVVFRVDSICFGFLLFLANRRFSCTSPWWRLLCPGAAIALGGLAVKLTYDIAQGNVIAEQLFPFASMLFGGSLIQSMLSVSALMERSPALAATSRFLGRISYSIYLFHLPALLVISADWTNLSVRYQFAAYMLVLLVFSSLFYRYFERPILSARPRFDAAKSAESRLLPAG
jgi:peptidoglycan/LPS O-acetylase OafA/YrhL